MSSSVKIVAQYHNYSPPVDVYRSVRVLLKYVPAEHLAGLRLIVLTNSEEVGKQIRALSIDERPPDVRALIVAMETLAHEYGAENVRLVFCFGM